MSYACACCNDTGSLSLLFHGDLDCVKCEVAEIRALIDHEYGMGANTALLRWQIFQRGRAYGKAESVPSGYKAVPLEPTPAMHDVMTMQAMKFHEWDALIAAAPELPCKS